MRVSKKTRQSLIHVATNTENIWVEDEDICELLPANPKKYGSTTLQSWLNPTLVVSRSGLKALFTRYCFAKLFSSSHYTVAGGLKKARCLTMLINKANPHCLRYLHYLLNKSPYAAAFISKSAGQALKNGYVLVSLDAPANMAVGGMIALRYGCWEYAATSKVFNDFVAAGVDEDAAWLTCASYGPIFGEYELICPSHGHSYIGAVHRLTKAALSRYKELLADGGFEWSPHTLRTGGAKAGSIQGIYGFAYSHTPSITGKNILAHLKGLVK